MSNETLRMLVVDGHAYAYRAFHALGDMRSPSGRPTHAIYGFIAMLGRLRAQWGGTHGLVVWDGGLSAARTAVWPEYKAQRPAMPTGLAEQLDELQAYLPAAGVASVCEDGAEADDLIAGYARGAVACGWSVVIASSDKDFMQLVGPGIGLVNPGDKSGQLWGAAEVQAKTGVAPAQVVDWLSLIGDAVDNIPGVPGVGPKTAAALLNEFGSVDELYGRLGEVKSARVQAALRDAAAAVRRNQELVRLPTDAPAGVDWERLRWRPTDAAALVEMFRRWGFRRWLAESEASLRGAAQAEMW